MDCIGGTSALPSSLLTTGEPDMAKHHDTGYKELFSHPELVEQLIEGFAPP